MSAKERLPVKIADNQVWLQCKYLMYCIFSVSEAPRLRQTVTVPGLDLQTAWRPEI